MVIHTTCTAVIYKPAKERLRTPSQVPHDKISRVDAPPVVKHPNFDYEFLALRSASAPSLQARRFRNSSSTTGRIQAEVLSLDDVHGNKCRWHKQSETTTHTTTFTFASGTCDFGKLLCKDLWAASTLLGLSQQLLRWTAHSQTHLPKRVSSHRFCIPISLVRESLSLHSGSYVAPLFKLIYRQLAPCDVPRDCPQLHMGPTLGSRYRRFYVPSCFKRLIGVMLSLLRCNFGRMRHWTLK